MRLEKGLSLRKLPAYLAFARLHQCDAVADSLKNIRRIWISREY